MAVLALAIIICFLRVFILLTWTFSRRWGLLGMFTAHIIIAFASIFLGMIALATGLWPVYDGIETLFGFPILALYFNAFALPVAIIAMDRRHQDQRRLARR